MNYQKYIPSSYSLIATDKILGTAKRSRDESFGFFYLQCLLFGFLCARLKYPDRVNRAGAAGNRCDPEGSDLCHLLSSTTKEQPVRKVLVKAKRKSGL
ncbi:hypothetical protein [Domibacillus epiphyticus]|uniref:hypothetical protein n=1 Tax=Domibacillus epiphyticus TaxID=1714355 RepID=UPI001300FAE1|nr:hypothetical protein [Domibacillus epiphyticus]